LEIFPASKAWFWVCFIAWWVGSVRWRGACKAFYMIGICMLAVWGAESNMGYISLLQRWVFRAQGSGVQVECGIIDDLIMYWAPAIRRSLNAHIVHASIEIYNSAL
jgi:hypothetical protein